MFSVVHAEDVIPDPYTTAPFITLVGDATVSVTQGETYTDAGATALDETDGDITANIIVSNPVDTATPSDYVVSYSVNDTAGNSATPVERTVTVVPLPPSPEPEPSPTETVLVRNGNTIIFQSVVDLPPAGTIDITDNTGEIHAVDADSALGLLYSIDQTDDSFSISDIQYYSSFGSLYLKCITPTGGDQLCDNWQYIVDTVTPWSAIDATILSGGEHVGFYFGNSHQVVLSETSIVENESFTATAQKYNYEDNTWSPLVGVTIGATVPNLDDPWNPTVVATQAVDENGTAMLTLVDAGTYTVGISEDYYFPSYTVEVITPPVQHGCGCGGGLPPTPVFSVPNAVAYLTSVQSEDGSFGGNDMYTDWAGIAFGAIDNSDSTRAKIVEYMASHNTVSSFITDNERHAMALLALGQNPYSFHGIDFITPIVQAFDGTQFGDVSLINDDIFALLPLSHSGYTENDEIISKAIAFIISKQKPNGSWEESVDMTSAAIQALELFISAPNVSNALSKASAYIVNNQSYDGGWGSVYATSWAIQAQQVLGVSWINNGNTGLSSLSVVQMPDGAALSSTENLQNRIWATSYAVPAALGKSWSSIMHSVEKPIKDQNIVNVSTEVPETILSESIVGDDQEQEIELSTEENETQVSEQTFATVPIRTPVVKESIFKSVSAPPDVVAVEDFLIMENSQTPVSALLATAEKSGVRIPTPVIIVGSIIVIGIGIFRLRNLFQ